MTTTEEINKENREKYGETCKRCSVYKQFCWCEKEKPLMTEAYHMASGQRVFRIKLKNN